MVRIAASGKALAGGVQVCSESEGLMEFVGSRDASKGVRVWGSGLVQY